MNNEDIKKIEYFLNQADEYYDGNIDIKDCIITKEVAEAIENLIKGYKELEEYQHKVNQILNLDDDNLDIVLVDNCQKGLKKCVTELDKENTRQHELLGKIHEKYQKDYIPKSKVKEKIEIKYRQAKGLYEQGVLPRPQYTMKLLTELKEELLQEGDDK